jgi:hypothetical protein
MSYPTTLDDLHAYAPVETEDVRTADFTSLQYELSVVEAVIGRKIAGTALSLKHRLNVAMNGDGTWKKEASCEDGPNGAGSRRYLSLIGKLLGTTPDARVSQALSAVLFSEAPVCITSGDNDATASGSYSARGVFVVTDITPAGVEFLFQTQALGGGSNLRMRAFLLSTLQTYPADVPFGAPPWRGGGILNVGLS